MGFFIKELGLLLHLRIVVLLVFNIYKVIIEHLSYLNKLLFVSPLRTWIEHQSIKQGQLRVLMSNVEHERFLCLENHLGSAFV